MRRRALVEQRRDHQQHRLRSELELLRREDDLPRAADPLRRGGGAGGEALEVAVARASRDEGAAIPVAFRGAPPLRPSTSAALRERRTSVSAAASSSATAIHVANVTAFVSEAVDVAKSVDR